MSKGVKIALILCLGALIALIATCGGLKVWFEANKDELKNMGEEADAAGIEFGLGSDQPGCVREGLDRKDSCGAFDPMCEAEVGMFVKACLATATPTEGFCDGVPSKTDILESATWAVGTCANMGRPDDQSCGRLMQRVQEHCFSE